MECLGWTVFLEETISFVFREIEREWLRKTEAHSFVQLLLESQGKAQRKCQAYPPPPLPRPQKMTEGTEDNPKTYTQKLNIQSMETES